MSTADAPLANVPVPSILVVAGPLILFGAQCLNGTDPTFAAFMSLAVLAGLASVDAAGGWKSAYGLVNATLIVKFLGFGLVVKTLALEATDQPLDAPFETATVCFAGFTGVWLGTLLAMRLPVPNEGRPLIQPVTAPHEYLRFYVGAMLLGSLPWLHRFYSTHDLLDVRDSAVFLEQAGGVTQLLNFLGETRFLALVCAVRHAHAQGSRFLLLHPLVLGTLIFFLGIGIYSTSKLMMVEPILYLLLALVQVRGLHQIRVWVITGFTLVIFVVFVTPYSNYVRYHGGRSGTSEERARAMADVMDGLIRDEGFREEVQFELTVKGDRYLPFFHEELSRFSLFVDADHLIAASPEPAGWYTISMGFQSLPPRFLYPEKPFVNVGNYLGHLAGDVHPSDHLTAIAYGFMADLHHSLGYPGAFFGSLLLMTSLFLWLRLFFGRPGLDSIWFALVIGHYHHLLVEGVFYNQVFDFWSPIVIFLFSAAVRTFPTGGRRGA